MPKAHRNFFLIGIDSASPTSCRASSCENDFFHVYHPTTLVYYILLFHPHFFFLGFDRRERTRKSHQTKFHRPESALAMRALTEPETKTLFEKLAGYTGRSLQSLLTDTATGDKGEPDRYVFRVQGNRVYYVRESLANLATSVARDNLLSLGTCLGKVSSQDV